ncbi:Protein phosphatase 1A [Rhizophlyctis rosea]|nr:Protein phosphatase 1A [Rhizophlyctis rosea]
MPSQTATYQIEKGVARVQGSRKYQEDEYAMDETPSNNPSIYMVFDGHGSGAYSSHAAKTFSGVLKTQPSWNEGRIDKALREAFLEEDRKMEEQIALGKGVARGGTTATVAVINGTQLFVANVGDSRAVVAQKQGTNEKGVAMYNVVRLSKDHKVTDETEAKRLAEANATVRKDRVVTTGHAINMSRALGDFDFKEPRNEAPHQTQHQEPHISSIPLDPSHEFVILASDGLWGYVDEYGLIPAVAELRSQGKSAQQIAQVFAEKCGEAPGADNTTVLVLFLKWQQ